MLSKNKRKLSKYKQCLIIMFGMISGISSIGQAKAQNLDADFVLNGMTSDQQVSYIAGVVEGLAFSRWQRDRPDSTGFQCIHAWYGKKDKWPKIEHWFGRHPDKQPGALLYILIKQECGA